MSSTNKTTNYNLPQFIGTDKPAWLGDINPAMSTIDTTMKANETLANQGIADASTAQTTATAAQTATDNASTAAATAQSTANTAIGGLSTANTKIDAINDKIQLTQYYTTSWQTAQGVTVAITLAQNDEGSLFKVYGYFNLTNNTNASINPFAGRITTKTIGGVSYGCVDLGLQLNSQPDEAYIINGAGFVYERTNSGNYADLYNLSLIVDADGKIFMNYYAYDGILSQRGKKHFLNASLYFNTNFGDLPEPD